MSESKPSGLKQPSRIGRPCSAQLPKPAVPPSPPRSSSESSSLSNINLPRKRNPLDELDDASISSGRRTSVASDRKSSLGSDSLWGDARRLSEAGVRRTSDSSVVLTEDTDSFIIGEKVWVGGSKPGTIAYIGETHFGPQDWAGVVLDDPIGKNDGSVGNTRYFQCDPKRGIFCRLTRLTRTPLLDGGDVSFTSAGTGTGAGNGSASIAPSRRPMSPPSSVNRPPSSASGRDLKIGDRVIVMSSTGSKAGMLRYIGKTEFAAGDWCGVECDDPVGKNDGSVQGARYFTCQPMYGLFAPIAKVSLSPSPNRRPSCAVHPPSSLIRQNTKDSITSSASSRISSVARKPSRPGTPGKAAATTNSTEAILKDKEVYIEQLLKERDLERLAVTRAASQAEEAERQLDVKKQELRQVQEIAEATQADLLHQIAELTREKQDLNIQLDDEHTKLDDLNFRFEEESLARTELETTCKTLEDRISQLEQLLAEETKRVEQLEQESVKQFEVEESLAKLKAALEEKDAQIKLLTDSSVSQEQLNSKLEQLTKECEEVKKRLLDEQQKYTNSMSYIEEKEKMLVEKDKESSKLISLKEKLESEIKNLNTTLTESEVQIKTSNNNCSALKLDLETLKTEFTKDKNILIEELKLSSDKLKTLQEEYANKTSDLSVLNLNITQLQNKLKVKEDEIIKLKTASEDEISSLKSEINVLKNNLTTTAVDFESKEEVLKMEISDLKQHLLEARKDSESKDSKIQSAIEESKKQLLILEDILKEREKQFISIKNDYEMKLEDIKNQFEAQLKVLNDTKDVNGKLITENDELKKEIHLTKQSVIGIEDKLQELTNLLEIQTKLVTVRDNEIKEVTKTKEDMKESLEALTLELGDWKRKFHSIEDKCAQLSEQKIKLENDLSELMNSSSDSSQQLSKLNDALRAKEKEFASLQEASAEVRRQADSDLQKTQQELKNVQEKSKADLESLQRKCNESLEIKEKECNTLVSKLTKLNETLEQQNQRIEKLLNDEKETKTKLAEYENIQIDLKNKLDKEIRSVAILNEELVQSRQGAGEVEISLRNRLEIIEKEKSNLLIDFNYLKNKLEQVQLQLEDKKKNEKDMNENLTSLIIEKDSILSKLEDKIQMITKEFENTKQEKEKLDSLICDKDVEIVKLQQKIEITKSESQQNLDEIKLQQISNDKLTKEIEKLNGIVSDSSRKKEQLENELQQQINLTNVANKKIDEIMTEKDTIIQNLQNEVDNLNHSLIKANTFLEEKESILNSLNSTLEEKKQSRDTLLEEARLHKSQANEKILSLEKDLATNKALYDTEFGKMKLSYEEIEVKLRESEEKQKLLSKDLVSITSLKDQLNIKQEEIETLKIALDLKTNKCKEFETFKNDVNQLQQENKTLSEELEIHKEASRELEDMKTQLKIMEEVQEETEKQMQIDRDSFNKSVHFQERAEVLDKQLKDVLRENEELKNKIKSQIDLSKSIPSETTNNNNSEDLNPQMQIDFLNSIIGDLQRKMELQEAELQQLRSNCQPGTTRVARVITPRLFCDICDEFDLHDTEDCPRQAMDSPPPQRSHNLPRGFERPYCETCEVFGHDTADCEETY